MSEAAQGGGQTVSRIIRQNRSAGDVHNRWKVGDFSQSHFFHPIPKQDKIVQICELCSHSTQS